MALFSAISVFSALSLPSTTRSSIARLRAGLLASSMLALLLLLSPAPPSAGFPTPQPHHSLPLATIQASARSEVRDAVGHDGETGASEGRGCPGTVYRWPSGAAVSVTRGFDPPPKPWMSGHRGVDLAMSAGDPVRAAGPGRVVYAGNLAGRGVVSIAHPDGLHTTYEPVEASVSAGDQVVAGLVIGTLQGGHRDGADALHWGARSGPDRYVNPLWLLCPPLIRLKPVS